MAFVSNSLNFPNLTVKSVPVNNDILLLADSAAGNAVKQTTVGDLASVVAGGSFVNVTTATQAMAINTSYVVNYTGGACTLTIPTAASSVQGSYVEIFGGEANTAGFIVGQNASQQIRMFSNQTTAGTGGTLTADNAFDVIRLVCDATSGGLTWTVSKSQGNYAGV